jgi:hypothetical protein
VVHLHIIHPLAFRRNFDGHSCSIPLSLSVSLLWWGEIESIGTETVSRGLVPAPDEGMDGGLLE